MLFLVRTYIWFRLHLIENSFRLNRTFAHDRRCLPVVRLSLAGLGPVCCCTLCLAWAAESPGGTAECPVCEDSQKKTDLLKRDGSETMYVTLADNECNRRTLSL